MNRSINSNIAGTHLGLGAAAQAVSQAPEPVAPIPAVIGELRLMVGNLSAEIDQLVDKLRPVCSPPSPDTKEMGSAGRPIAMTASPFELAIEDIRMSTQLLAGRIYALRESIRC